MAELDSSSSRPCSKPSVSLGGQNVITSLQLSGRQGLVAEICKQLQKKVESAKFGLKRCCGKSEAVAFENGPLKGGQKLCVDGEEQRSRTGLKPTAGPSQKEPLETS